jgi:hypothetical protein
MTKYGVDTEPACFASSIGVRSRRDARALAALFPTAFGSDFASFMAWVSTLEGADVRAVVGEATAALFLDRAAALVTPREALELALTDEGTLSVPLRGIRQASSAEALSTTDLGAELQLLREYDNPTDVNAIRVYAGPGAALGYVAREVARVLAPLLDLDGGPVVTARLMVRPNEVEAIEKFDAVRIQVVLTPAG